MVIVEGAPPTTAPKRDGEAADDNPIRQGLVSSIRFAPLRCHPSDAPDPNDPAFPDPAALPTSSARIVRGKSSTGGGGSTRARQDTVNKASANEDGGGGGGTQDVETPCGAAVFASSSFCREGRE